jgi:hypothetical protein
VKVSRDMHPCVDRFRVNRAVTRAAHSATRDAADPIVISERTDIVDRTLAEYLDCAVVAARIAPGLRCVSCQVILDEGQQCVCIRSGYESSRQCWSIAP